MEVRTIERDGAHVVQPNGRLDTAAATAFEDELNRVIEQGALQVDVDFSQTDFVTSSGLRVLLATAKRLSGLGGELTVSGLNQTVEEVFDIAGLGSLMALWKR